MASVAAAWRVLVVDDEEDVHTVTRLALRRRTWRKRGFELVSARSAKEALEKLGESGAEPFHAAIIDVVMETPNAGLELVDARFACALAVVAADRAPDGTAGLGSRRAGPQRLRHRLLPREGAI